MLSNFWAQDGYFIRRSHAAVCERQRYSPTCTALTGYWLETETSISPFCSDKLSSFLSGAHPIDHRPHLFGVPSPKTLTIKRLRPIVHLAHHVIVDVMAGLITRLNRKDAEAHLLNKEFEHTVLELKELPCAVCLLTQTDKAHVFENSLERQQISEAVPGLNRF